MKVSCPVCSQRIALDAENLAELRGADAFNCPACGARIPLPQPTTAASAPPAADVATAEIEGIARSFDARYQIKRLLGRGGMGAVYEGFDTRLDRRVAIKILPPETGGHRDALVRFEREAKAMAALDHPNIVHIHDYGQTPDGNPYFVMEFIDGMDVHKLRRSGQLDLPGALDLISQVCAALHYAHSRGIVHRDIKPGNILVTRDGVAKVADFGLAKVLGTEDLPRHDVTLTLSGTALGTPDYMAPEQFEGGHVDHRADIYSLGIMLYDLLTGSPPRGAWPPPSQRVQIDVRLDEIVLRALQQNPCSRYQAASEVRADIDSVKFSTGGGPLPPGSYAEPLPSSRSIAPVTPAPHRASAPSQENVRPSQAAQLPDAREVAASARGLGTTLLILGLLAIAITAGLAFYMANRKPVENHTRSESVTTHETHNTYHTRIVAPGTASAADREAIEDIKPFQNGFLGITKDTLTWNDAQSLAERCGAEIPSVDETNPVWQSLLDELKREFPNHADTSLWVRQASKACILKGVSVSIPEFNPPSETRHRALLHWLPQKAAPSVPQTEPAPPVHASDDWINLFDGLDVSKWKGSKDAGFPAGAWGIEGGALRNFHGANDQGLNTRETFRDFELEFEWKFGPGGNSGIFYGTREFQLVDDVGHPNGKIPVTSCGALCYFIPPNANKRLEPAGKYNRGKLVVRGNQVEHWINGEKIVEYELGGPALKSLVESGQFKTLPGYKKIDTTAGPTTIGLQSHGGNVWFRNIRIRRLDGPTSSDPQNSGSSLNQDSSAQGSPAGVNAAGSPGNWTFVSWGETAADPKSAFILTKDDVLICPREKKAWYLMSSGIFPAMKFSIEFKHPIDASGHGGQVVVSSPGPRDPKSSDYTQRIPLGFEFKLRSGVCGQLELPRADYPAELPFGQIRDGRRVSRSRQKDPVADEWNKLEIDCTADNSVVARLNGEVVNAVSKVESVEGRIILWPIDGVHFRNPTVTVNGKTEKLDFTLTDSSVKSPSPPASAGPLPWTNTDGKTIQAEFVGLDGESVVIRKDDKEFKILLAKLTPASREQALNLAKGMNPAPQ